MAETNPARGPKERILLGLGGAVALVLWFQIFHVPQHGIHSQRRAQVLSVRKKLQEARRNIKQLPSLEAELKRLSSGNGMAFTFSPEEQLPELLEMIAQAARSSQVKLLTVRPQMDLNQLHPGPTGFLELPVRLEATAGYHQIGSFLDALERSERLVRLDSLEIVADPRDIWEHQVHCDLKVYLLPVQDRSSP